MTGQPTRVLVWNEHRHEKHDPRVSAVYPEGIHQAIAGAFGDPTRYQVNTATLDDPDHGLSEAALGSTDVLVWWAHVAHHEVSDAAAERVYRRVMDGMGLIVLHSALHCRVFLRLLGTSCAIKWREAGEKERIWVVEPGHPIASGLPEYFELPHEEMYGEWFDIPPPDELVLLSWFEGGEVFRSGCCFRRGKGRIFYFRPGHETFPTYYDPHIRRVIANAADWAVPQNPPAITSGNRPPLEKIG